MAYKNITAPAGGKISIAEGKLNVPDQPIIPFIRGDGTGPDIWAASQRVFDAAVQKAYGGKRKVSWFEVFAGEPDIATGAVAANEGDDRVIRDGEDAVRDGNFAASGRSDVLICHRSRRVKHELGRWAKRMQVAMAAFE